MEDTFSAWLGAGRLDCHGLQSRFLISSSSALPCRPLHCSCDFCRDRHPGRERLHKWPRNLRTSQILVKELGCGADIHGLCYSYSCPHTAWFPVGSAGTMGSCGAAVASQVGVSCCLLGGLCFADGSGPPPSDACSQLCFTDTRGDHLRPLPQCRVAVSFVSAHRCSNTLRFLNISQGKTKSDLHKVKGTNVHMNPDIPKVQTRRTLRNYDNNLQRRYMKNYPTKTRRT